MGDQQISKDAQIKRLARELVRGSIIEDAASRFVEMVLKEAHDSRIKPLQDRIEELEAKLAKAVEALVQISRIELTFPEELRPTARAAIAEINGGGDE